MYELDTKEYKASYELRGKSGKKLACANSKTRVNERKLN